MKTQILQDLKNICNKYQILSKKIYKRYGKYLLKDIDKYFGSFDNAIKEYNQLYSINIQLENRDNRLLKKRKCSNVARQKISIKHKKNWENKKCQEITYDELVYIIYDSYHKYRKTQIRFISANYFIDKSAILDLIKAFPGVQTYKQFVHYIGIASHIIKNKKTITLADKNDFIEEALAYIRKNGYFFYSDFLKQSKYSQNSIRKILKLTANDILNLLDPELKRKVIQNSLKLKNNDRKVKANQDLLKAKTKDEYIAIIKECYRQCTGKFTLTYILTNTDLTEGYIKKYFGGFSKMLYELNLPINIRSNITKTDVLQHMKKLYDKYGKLNSIIQRKDGIISQAMIKRLFGNFNNLLTEFNTTYNTCLIDKPFRPSDNDLLYEAKQLINKFGRLNTSILRQYSKYTYQTYLNHFQSIANLCNQLNIINYFNTNTTEFIVISRISKILNDTDYIMHKKFNWLINPKTQAKLHLDAYFPKYNLAIEYDGQQHFEQVKFFSSSLEERQYRDKLKDQLCKEHNITLLRIAYNDDLSEQALRKKIVKLLNLK